MSYAKLSHKLYNQQFVNAVRGFHLKWKELPLDANVKKWSVHILNLDRNRRHLDRATLQEFWESLDKYVGLIYYVFGVISWYITTLLCHKMHVC